MQSSREATKLLREHDCPERVEYKFDRVEQHGPNDFRSSDIMQAGENGNKNNSIVRVWAYLSREGGR